MSQTRADLEQKLTRLEARAREISPRRMARRYAPAAKAPAGAIAAIAALIATVLAVRRYRKGGRRSRLRTELAGYGRW